MLVVSNFTVVLPFGDTKDGTSGIKTLSALSSDQSANAGMEQVRSRKAAVKMERKRFILSTPIPDIYLIYLKQGKRRR